MGTAIQAPEFVGTRSEASALLECLPHGLSGTTVVIECGQLVLSTPSFVSQLVWEILVDRDADGLVLAMASRRLCGMALAVGEDFGVADRLRVEPASSA